MQQFLRQSFDFTGIPPLQEAQEVLHKAEHHLVVLFGTPSSGKTKLLECIRNTTTQPVIYLDFARNPLEVAAELRVPVASELAAYERILQELQPVLQQCTRPLVLLESVEALHPVKRNKMIQQCSGWVQHGLASVVIATADLAVATSCKSCNV